MCVTHRPGSHQQSIELGKSVPTDFKIERDSNSATTAISTAYVIRKREYCYEEGTFRGASNPLIQHTLRQTPRVKSPGVFSFI